MPSSPHRIAVLALDEVVGLDLGTPAQVFGAARTPSGARLYTVEVCTPGGRPVRSTAGYRVLPEHGLELLEAADLTVEQVARRSGFNTAASLPNTYSRA